MTVKTDGHRGSDKHVRFLQQYGECFKTLDICSVENAGDEIGMAHFPNLELLKFVAPFDIKVQKSDVMVNDCIDAGLVVKAWASWYKKQTCEHTDDEDTDYEFDQYEDISEQYVKLMRLKKGTERMSNITVNLRLNFEVKGDPGLVSFHPSQ